MDGQLLDAATLDAKLRAIFAPHVDPLRQKDPVAIEVRRGGKSGGGGTVEGHIVGVYAHGLLFQGPYVREFFSYVDFYTGHARVRSGAVKPFIAAALPQIYNLALATIRERPRPVSA